MPPRIGELLIKESLINQDQLEAALQEQAHTGEFLGEILIRLGYVNEEVLLKVLATQFNTRFVNLDNIRVNPQVIKMVPRSLVWEYKVLPIDVRAAVMLIAVSNPLDMWPMSVLQEKLDLVEVQIVLACKDDILKSIFKYYGTEVQM